MALPRLSMHGMNRSMLLVHLGIVHVHVVTYEQASCSAMDATVIELS